MNWSALSTRISLHFDYLDGNLRGKEESYYKDKLWHDIKDGRIRNLLRYDTNEALYGYYGARGFDEARHDMSSRFLDPFGKPKNNWTFSGSFLFYLQAVLIPALLVRLVMEHMGMNKDEEDGKAGARRILEESRELGELLCEIY